MSQQDNFLTIQFFLDEDGVCEVSADVDDYERLRCTCPKGQKRRKCRHTQFVRDIINTTGRYSVKLPDTLSDEEVVEAMEDRDRFRHLLAHYSEVKVLDE